jgi:hypothetical protein
MQKRNRYCLVIVPVMVLGACAAAQAQTAVGDLPPVSEAFTAPAPIVRAQAPVPRTRVDAASLAPMTADSIGLSPVQTGVSPIQPGIAVHQLVQLPVVVGSPTLQALAVKHLAAEWPLAAEQRNAEAVPGKLLAARVIQLISWGYLPEAEQLLAQVPSSMRTDEIAWASLLVALVKDDTTSACTQASDGVAAFTSMHWQLAAIYCHALQGRPAESQLGLDMLEEQAQQPDALLREVVTSLNQKKPLKRASIPSVPGLWDQVLILKSALKKPLLDLTPQFATPLLARMQADKAVDAAVRTAAQKELARRTAAIAPGEWITPARIGLGANPTLWQKREAARTYAMLTVLGIPLDDVATKQWASQAAMLATSADEHAPQEVASTEALSWLRDATKGKDPRAIVLSALAALPADLANAEDAVLVQIISAMRNVGMQEEARQLAAESIAAIGAKVKADPRS